MEIPFQDGPVTITSIPPNFQSKSSQILSLFEYLQKIKESFMCWVIFFDEELGMLNLKLITQFEFR